MKKPQVLSYPLSTRRRLIRLGGCPGWFESLLGAHSLFWFCHEVAHTMIKTWRPSDQWLKMSRACQNLQNDVHPSKTQISLGIHLKNFYSLSTDIAYSKDWSARAHAQADLSLCWAHISFCWFCHWEAQIWIIFFSMHFRQLWLYLYLSLVYGIID